MMKIDHKLIGGTLIEPDWDWNMIAKSQLKISLLTLIEPDWDWNLFQIGPLIRMNLTLIEPDWISRTIDKDIYIPTQRVYGMFTLMQRGKHSKLVK